MKKFIGFLAQVEQQVNLEDELAFRKIEVLFRYGPLFICEQKSENLNIYESVVFAQDIWFNLQFFKYNSIKNAQEILKEKVDKSTRFVHYPLQSIRRGELVLEKLNQVKRFKKYNFKEELPNYSLAVFSLISNEELIFSSTTSSRVPLGEIEFNEDKANPPSRAYLKLWEVFTLFPELIPPKDSLVLDMGCTPGGWTYVLTTLDLKIIAVDKAPLASSLLKHPLVTYKQESAFGLRPSHVGLVHTFFSDIICYPAKLLELVNRWREQNLVGQFICTIKFQHPTDFETLMKFQEIPNSKVVHLHHNKHEVTWILCLN